MRRDEDMSAMDERMTERAGTEVEALSEQDRRAVVSGYEALLRLMGRDPLTDPAVIETPARAVKAMLEVAGPTEETSAEVLLSKRFSSPGAMPVFVGPVHFTSMCEHHLLPFTGRAWVAYAPEGDEVVGLSKLARLVRLVAHRPQIQEGMTRDIVTALMDHAPAAGAWCLIEGEHSCMTLRGVLADEARMVTSWGLGTMSEGTPGWKAVSRRVPVERAG